jgi:hypothetical protein
MMYCSGCGTELEGGLNYCNRCGNRVAKSESVSVAENLSQAISYIGGFGLLGFVFGFYMTARAGVPAGPLVLISVLYLATLFGICYMILQQTAPFTLRKRNNTVQGRDDSPAYIKSVTTAQLREPADHPISVTEHTTRTLDKVPAARK